MMNIFSFFLLFFTPILDCGLFWSKILDELLYGFYLELSKDGLKILTL